MTEVIGMRRLLSTLLGMVLVGGCSSPTVAVPATASPAAVASASAVPTPKPSPTPVDLNAVRVPGPANIFGAGHSAPPAPGGGGNGVMPPLIGLPAGAKAVTFPLVTGEVNPIVGITSPNGPAGDLVGPTDVASFGGIAGIVHKTNGMFLVGVFLTGAEPTDPAPERLDFTHRGTFDTLSPALGQTFLIGDGVGRRFVIPEGATRVFLGFADGAMYQGAPGWYGNNGGELKVKVVFD